MPGGKSDYLESEILNHVLGGPDFVRPATGHVALSTTTPTDTGGITEPSGGAYARQAITNDATNFPASSGSNPTEKKNGAVVTFPVATAAWGTIVGWALFDAATAGNMLYWGDVTPSKTVGLDDQPKFAVNGLKVTED